MDHNAPSGLMDGGSLGVDSFNKEHYSLCDMSDEEVHFSREPIVARYYHQHKNNNNNYYTPSTSNTTTYQYYHLDGEYNLNSGNFTDLSLNNQSNSANAERIKSNKLLQSIGSKLKRGSCLLAAPKLVGHYLLGITIQNWSEFLNLSKLTIAPCNRHQWTRRLLNNLSHFQGNYLCLSLILGLYCILTTPLLLLALVAYLVALYLVTARSANGRHLVLAGGFRPNLRQQYSFITLVTLPLLWVAGAPSAVFWVIGASFVVVGVHASMYSSELAGAEESVIGQHVGPAQQVVVPSAGQVKQVQRQSKSVNPHTVRRPDHYLPLPGSASLPSGTVVGQLQEQRKQSLGYSSTITQWILSGGKQKQQQQTETRVPEVTIISQDYAGLGRVYEV